MPGEKPQSSVLPAHTEAAFTLLLYCELLRWEERPLRELLHYPAQTEWQRKEGLCRKILHYFSKGKVGTAGPRLAWARRVGEGGCLRRGFRAASVDRCT